MIKKMMAMLVAISCAFGAWADVTGHLSGTDFSPLRAGSFVTGLDDNGEDTGTTYWYNGDQSDFEGTVVSNSPSEVYLDFESNITNPLYRTISDSYGLSPSQFTATPIGDGLFIDTHVQFTPYLVNENHPAPTKVTDDDKLIVWVRETEVDGDANITNLIVTAGYITESGTPVASNYVSTLSSAEVSALCTNQCRLTIKSYQNITAYNGVYVMGFVVYIDESAIGYDGDAFDGNCNFIKAGLKPNPAQYYSQGGSNNKLFPCLMRYVSSSSGSIDDYSKLSAVGYAGMGKIGDVIFDSYSTTYPPFAGDARNFSVYAGPDIQSYMYNGEPYSGTNVLTAPAAAASVIISNVTYASGYKHKDDTWYNEYGEVVSNRVDASGKDYGTFYFADGDVFTLVGFQANYIVNGTEYDNLTDALDAALDGGYTLVLNNDVEITEFDGSLAIGVGDTLVLDLQGHTIKGTGDEHTPTIINDGGTLTIIDTSTYHDGKVLHNDNSNLCLGSYSGSTTTLNAGIYEEVDDLDGDLTTITINGGTYLDVVYGPDAFYMSSCIATGKQIVDWIQDGDNNYYAVIGESSGDRWDITFSTNNVVVTEWNLTVNDGDPIGNHIPNFTGGSWDAPAPTAETVVTSDTNFNYTIIAPYTLTYVTDKGTAPDAVSYTVESDNFELAAAPTAEGWTFAGWVIGSVTNAAGATFVVADHLEDTTATAVWAPISYTLTYVTDKGTAPDAVSYTVESNNFELAAAPTAEGWTFAGWVIGSVTNAAGATFVVADHLENTTATAVWTQADPWAPTEQTDAAASNKVVSIFGEGSDVANHVTTLAQYEALVTYIQSTTDAPATPANLTADQKTWMWKSYILGANPLFDEEPAVQITSLTANATAGKWDFTVKVTEGESTDAYNVAADKVGALVKIRTSLSTGTWVEPTAGNIEAVKPSGGDLIKVTVNFGDGASGFMKVSE